MLQMPVVENILQQDEDDSECRCPGYFQEQCEEEAAQGCVWSAQGPRAKQKMTSAQLDATRFEGPLVSIRPMQKHTNKFV